jgi:hypothetical protein
MGENVDEVNTYFCKKGEPTEGEAVKVEHIMYPLQIVW